MMEPAKDSLDLGIFVSDIKKSLNFYQNTLGLKFVEKIPLWFGTMYRLRFGSSDLKLVDPDTLLPRGPIGLESQLGFRYVTFVVRNLSKVCAGLHAEVIEFVIPEKEARPGVRIAMVKDPDGKRSWNSSSELHESRSKRSTKSSNEKQRQWRSHQERVAAIPSGFSYVSGWSCSE